MATKNVSLWDRITAPENLDGRMTELKAMQIEYDQLASQAIEVDSRIAELSKERAALEEFWSPNLTEVEAATDKLAAVNTKLGSLKRFAEGAKTRRAVVHDSLVKAGETITRILKARAGQVVEAEAFVFVENASDKLGQPEILDIPAAYQLGYALSPLDKALAGRGDTFTVLAGVEQLLEIVKQHGDAISARPEILKYIGE